MRQESHTNILDILLSRKGLFITLALVLFILFRAPIWQVYDETVVDKLLSRIDTSWIVDILFFLLIIFLIISTRHFIIRKKRITNYFFLTILFLFILFFYCRVFSGRYSFQSFVSLTSLHYIDFVFILFVCVAVIKFVNWIYSHEPPLYKDSPFLVDKPIEVAIDDKFSRKLFAQKIALKIQSKLQVEKAGALAIGINGPWGSGKTSFTNMIKESIDKNNRILIDFNPWRSSSSRKIVEDFFELLIKEIKPYDPSLSNKIADYARTLTKIEENIITKSTEAIADFLFEEKSKNEAYDSINNSIEKIKKQIIIFIDDLDRLDKKEVIEVLRVIRNTANFHNVVYIVSYDKGYIQTAIKDFNKYNFKSFLEKIFQFEFTLPMYERGVLRTEIKRLLKNELKEEFSKEIDRIVDSREYSGVNFTNEVVKTYRDVIRFVNSLLFEIETVKEEVFFYDFYLLQLLKLEYPKVYEALIENRDLFFIKDGDKGTYRLKTEEEAWTSDDASPLGFAFDNIAKERSYSDKDKKITGIERYLQDNAKSLGITGHDKKLIKLLLDTLLSLKDSKNMGNALFSLNEPKYEDQDIQLYKSFAYPANFHKYFAFKLYEGDISAKEFEEYRRKEFDEYKTKAFEWIHQGKYSILIDRLEKIEDFMTVREFENQILILIEIGRHQLRENIGNAYWIDLSLILKNLEYPIKRKDKASPFSTIVEYRDFLLKIFTNPVETPLIESILIARIIGGRLDIPISMEELSKINLKYFEEYCNNHNKVTQELRLLHSNAIRPTDGYSKNYEIIPEAQTLFETYFLENLEGSGLSGFIRHSNPQSDYFHVDQEWIKTFFHDQVWENLEAYLGSAENIKIEKDYYNEFLQFYALFKANDYKPVEFIFKFLTPSLWTGGTKSKPSNYS